MPTQDIQYYGVRHHGPGSSNRLLESLEQKRPSLVLIEGPSDCSELLPMLAHRQMKPPVALLAYAADTPECSFYYPFADFSPEYQAACWAVSNNVPLAFIDLPVNIQLAQMLEENKTSLQVENDDTEEKKAEDIQPYSQIVHDPIGTLAKLAGYEDGESWWNDLIENNSSENNISENNTNENNKDEDSTQVFSTIELAMTALREHVAEIDVREQQREAHMRLEIAKAQKTSQGSIAVVCGAWHVPALKEKHALKNDRALLKELPTKLSKNKVKSTWVPWTSPRLANVSGYGAGVDAPMWYQHLWEQHADSNSSSNSNTIEKWLTHIAHALRDKGHIVSTASVIEASRLSTSLAVVRNRPSPGFEEIREAVIACLCFGEPLIWKEIESKILLGNKVGEIPDNAPLVPLLEDLQRLQKKNKLKPEALEREISLDLRSDSGLAKSLLLHRLNILDVAWGRISDAGSSRGTFRERWVLSWQPEYSVQLVENLVYGSTIEQAANNKISEVINNASNLNTLAETIQLCLESQLTKAAEVGLSRLEDRAAHTSDAMELISSLPPLVDINRYGTARELSLEHIETLVNRLAIQASLALPYACRNLNEEESQYYRNGVNKAHNAILLAELDETVMEDWWQALESIIENKNSSFQLVGLCSRLLYQAKKLAPDDVKIIMQKMLSPAVPPKDAAKFFEGFFAEAVQRLLYDQNLLNTVETWILNLDEESFVEFLPLFRRVFSELDAMERKRMIDTILKGRDQSDSNKIFNPMTLPLWPDHLDRLGKLLHRNKSWAQKA